jgi:mannonate dehydratase
VEYVSLPASETSNAETFTKMRERYESAGIKVYNIGSGVGPSGSLHNMPEVTLNLPGRDQKIEEYKQYLRYLGKAGIHYTTYAHMGNGIWSSGRATIRGSSGRELDLSSPNRRGNWGGKSYTEPLSHGRVFTKDEIWENYTYFIKQVAPVAEEAGVKIGIHPDDPPAPVLAGVPRCIFGNFEGYKRAMEIANSPNVGIHLDVGNIHDTGFAEQWIEIHGPRITRIHVKDVMKKRGRCGHESVYTNLFLGDNNWPAIRAALMKVGYDGWLIAEMEARYRYAPDQQFYDTSAAMDRFISGKL